MRSATLGEFPGAHDEIIHNYVMCLELEDGAVHYNDRHGPQFTPS